MNRSRLTWSLAFRNIERFSGPQTVGSSAAEGFCNTTKAPSRVRCNKPLLTLQRPQEIQQILLFLIVQPLIETDHLVRIRPTAFMLLNRLD